MIKSLRGMNDIINDNRFELFLTTATEIAKRYGFTYIETPKLEETSLFVRSVGESSDIIGKEMYRFTDKGENDVCLRPEGTAGIVRAFLQSKFDKQNSKQRFYYYGSMFRYERPQKGRLREFHQFGIESFGFQEMAEDATLIALCNDIFDALGISSQLLINSLGCPKCRPQYKENLIHFLDKHTDDICEDCIRRKNTNPIRVLDCKNSKCQEIYQDAPLMIDALCDECINDFESLKKYLETLDIDYTIDTNLVRGLDYYSKTAFEFTSKDIGAQSAIAGGGRYDTLIEQLGGNTTPAVGFAIGIERLLELINIPDATRIGYYFGTLDDTYFSELLKLAHIKRHHDKVVVEYKSRSLKSHLKEADKANARYCCILGENEIKNETLWIKDLQEKSETLTPFSEL